MYQLLRGRSLKSLSTGAVPPLVLALLLAELFFKWHSFALECVGFLATWFVLDLAWTKLTERVSTNAGRTVALKRRQTVPR